MIYDYVIHSLGAPYWAIYGRLIPSNSLGPFLMAAALLPALLLFLLRRRVTDRQQHFGIILVALVAYVGAYVSSCRWLDDLFVNLAHSYNLWHHGRFSVLPHRMVNGTVEIVYYLLLTPFAWSHASLIIANYAFGLLIGALHLILLASLLRRFRPFPRLMGLCAFAVMIPLIQTFSGGYGNGLVSLTVFLGLYFLIQNRVSGLYLCCAALPLLRPDAIIYSAALIVADFLSYRRIALRWWIPTVISAAVYFGVIRLMFHQWTPTPMALKTVTWPDLQSGLSSLQGDLQVYFFFSQFHLIFVLLTALFFVSPALPCSPLTKRQAAACLFSLFPVLVFFHLTNVVGYNPTLFRYYVGFELCMTVTGVFGLATVLEAAYAGFSPHGLPTALVKNGGRQAMFQGCALAALLLGTAWATRDSLQRDDGKSVGIEMGSWDFKRLQTLAFAGRYCDAVLPKTWRIASTEMDTFGYSSGRDIVDLWGYSNPQIARSPLRNRAGIKCNPSAFLNSDVEVFWLRTIDARERDPAVRAIGTASPQKLPGVLADFPNLSPMLWQAGDLMTVFHRYDVVRVRHASRLTTVLLVRKDLMPAMQQALRQSGHTLVSETPFDYAEMRNHYNPPQYVSSR